MAMVLYTQTGPTRAEATSRLYDSLPAEAANADIDIHTAPISDGYQASCEYDSGKVAAKGGGTAPGLLEKLLSDRV